jgi:hypothetical protein
VKGTLGSSGCEALDLKGRNVAAHERICAEQRELLCRVAEFDRREAYKVDGA